MVEGESFSLIFLEGRGAPGRWKTSASKLKSISVAPVPRLVKEPQGDGCLLRECANDSPCKGVSYVDVVFRGKGDLGEAVWIQGGREELKRKHCLVCRLGDFVVGVLELGSLKSWARFD